MFNISILTDFDSLATTIHFEKLASPPGLETYSICTGGNFIFISNTNNRTIRFSNADFHTADINDSKIKEWISRIHILYPNF